MACRDVRPAFNVQRRSLLQAGAMGALAGEIAPHLAQMKANIAEALGVAFSTLIQAPDLRDPGRIEELAWAGEHPQSRAVLLGTSAARRDSLMVRPVGFWKLGSR